MMKLISAVGFVVMVNLLFFFAQLGIANANPTDSAPTLMNYEDSLISQYDTGNYTLQEFSADELPNPEAQVNTEGNIFTDMFSTIRSWFLDLPGVSHIVAVVNGVPNFLKAVGLPIEISYALGWLWHFLSIFIIVAWMKS